MNTDVAILILAAGQASRMGAPKQILPWGDKTLLGHVISKVQHTGIGPVFCLLGAHADQVRPFVDSLDVKVLENPAWQEGLGGSLAAGIRQVEAHFSGVNAILIVLGDQPLVEEDHLHDLVRKYKEYPHQIIASDYSQGAGVPAIFPRDFFPYLKQLSGDTGARKLMRQWADWVVTMVSPGQLIDIDTPEEYQQHLDAFNRSAD